MGKSKGNYVVNPHLRLGTPYTRFARDFWACYKARGHEQALMAKPRFDKAEGRIIFEFGDSSQLSPKSETDLSLDDSARKTLFGFCKDAPECTITSPITSPLSHPDVSSSSEADCRNRDCVVPPVIMETCQSEPVITSTQTVTTTNQLEGDHEDDVQLLPDPDRDVPSCHETIDVTTSSMSVVAMRDKQGQKLGLMSKIISEKWSKCDEELKEEYKRQTAQEKSNYLETMIAVHLRHSLPLPPVKIEESKCLNMLFKSLYRWYKEKPTILEMGFGGRSGSDPVISFLRVRCQKFLKSERDGYSHLTEMASDRVSASKQNDQLTPPHQTAPQFARQNLQTQCSKRDPSSPTTSFYLGAPVACSSPKTAPAPILSPEPENGGPMGRKMIINFNSPPRPETSCSLQPLTPPRTPNVTVKATPGSNYTFPNPSPPTMLYSLYGMNQERQNKPTWSETTWSEAARSEAARSEAARNAAARNACSQYGVNPRIFYHAYQWPNDTMHLTHYSPLSTPPEFYTHPGMQAHPTMGSPVQGNDFYVPPFCLNPENNF